MSASVETIFAQMSDKAKKSAGDGLDKMLAIWSQPRVLLNLLSTMDVKKIMPGLNSGKKIITSIGGTTSPSFGAELRFNMIADDKQVIVKDMGFRFALTKATATTSYVVPYSAMIDYCELQINGARVVRFSGETLFQNNIANIKSAETTLLDSSEYNLDGDSTNIASASVALCRIRLDSFTPFIANVNFMKSCELVVKLKDYARCVDDDTLSVATTITDFKLEYNYIGNPDARYLLLLKSAYDKSGIYFTMDDYRDSEYTFVATDEVLQLKNDLRMVTEIKFHILDVNSATGSAVSYSDDMNTITSAVLYSNESGLVPYTNDKTIEISSANLLSNVYLERGNDCVAQENVYIIPLDHEKNDDIYSALNLKSNIDYSLKITGSVITDKIYISYKSLVNVCLRKDGLWYINYAT